MCCDYEPAVLPGPGAEVWQHGAALRLRFVDRPALWLSSWAGSNLFASLPGPTAGQALGALRKAQPLQNQQRSVGMPLATPRMCRSSSDTLQHCTTRHHVSGCWKRTTVVECFLSDTVRLLHCSKRDCGTHPGSSGRQQCAAGPGASLQPPRHAGCDAAPVKCLLGAGGRIDVPRHPTS